MLFCTTHLTTEYLTVESRVKHIAIPFFSILSAVVISTYPFRLMELAIHLLLSVLTISLLWYAIRYMVFKLRYIYPDDRYIYRRIAIQSSITIVLSVAVFILDHLLYFFVHHGSSFASCLWTSRTLFLAIVSYTFLVNVVYESFYLFLRLSEMEINAEHQKKLMAESQYHNLMNQLNPHFLFNSFNTLASIIEEDQQRATAFVHELSTSYRYMLSSQKTTWTTLHDELAFINTYISMLKKRYETAFEVTIAVDDTRRQHYILPLSLQLLVENALKHNEISSRHPLLVEIYTLDNYLVVKNKKRLRKMLDTSPGIGLQNISQRYNLLANKDIIITNDDEYFVVNVPLCPSIPQKDTQKDTTHECCNH